MGKFSIFNYCRYPSANRLLFIVALLFTSVSIFAQEKPFVLGITEQLPSKELSETRTLNIYLPDGYDKDKTTKYPVIYLLDGSADEDFVHIVGVVQFLTMIESMPKSIIVGIANVDRRRDFTFPTSIDSDRKAYPTTGSSAKFISFLGNELQPYIERKYRTGAKTIIGQSLGGLVATEILIERPELFDNYMIVSPSLWWDAESLLGKAQKKLKPAANRMANIYLSVGTEGKQMEEDVKKFKALVEQFPDGFKMFYAPMPEEDHLTILHNSIYKGLIMLNARH